MSLFGVTLQVSLAVTLLIVTIATGYLSERLDFPNREGLVPFAQATGCFFIALGPTHWLRSILRILHDGARDASWKGLLDFAKGTIVVSQIILLSLGILVIASTLLGLSEATNK